MGLTSRRLGNLGLTPKVPKSDAMWLRQQQVKGDPMNIGEIVREIVIEPIELPERDAPEPRTPVVPEPAPEREPTAP